MIGLKIYEFAKLLWPINRSITGEGVRNTLKIIQKKLPNLKIHSVPSGTKVFDWTIPKEWHISKAYIITPSGKKICDFSKNNLHLVGYSIPFKGKISLDKLQNHLHSIPSQPEAIPYVTSYYKNDWGFCISQKQRNLLKNGIYEVVIDSKLFNGYLNFGELIIPGKTEKEILLSTYICHPSMANNELSGPSVTTYLAKWLSEKFRRYSYRIIFIPETIGSITYLNKNINNLKKNIIAGFNITCVGDERAYSYLPSRNGNTLSDHVAKHVLKWIDKEFISYSWLDRGSDERQYCSPGIDLPIASILRSKYGEYPEYHTSLDKLGVVVTPNGLDGGYWSIRKALELLERNVKYETTNLGEPQMGKRGLYPNLSKKNNIKNNIKIMMDFLSLCDGHNTLLEISNYLNLPSWELYPIIDKLYEFRLIKEVD